MKVPFLLKTSVNRELSVMKEITKWNGVFSFFITLYDSFDSKSVVWFVTEHIQWDYTARDYITGKQNVSADIEYP